jgi:HD-like signal output (HDOD) protein
MGTAAPVPPAPPAPAAADHALDRAFSVMLLSCPALLPGAATAAEQDLLALLAGMASQGIAPDLVPRMPAVLPRLIALVRRDDAAPRELAELVARDASLVGEVMRLANSAHYGSRRELANLQDAVLVLGQIGLAQLVARVAVRPIFSARQGRFGATAGATLLALTDRSAHASSFLCAGRPDQFSAFLAGTMAQLGLVVAVRLLDQRYRAPEAPASQAFHDALWQHARHIAAAAARQWSLPGNVVAALTGHADGSATDALARAVQAADRAAKRQLLGAAAADLAPPGGDELRAVTELERQFGTPAA